MNSLKDSLLLFFFFVSLSGYMIIGYGIERTNSDWLLVTFGVLFIIYFLSLKWIDSTAKVKIAIAVAILFRISLLFSIPTLSDDFYRFIWDGRLLAHGTNPFAYPPEFIMNNGLPAFLSTDLFSQLNSQIHFTVYPAVCQYLFWISAVIGGQNMIANIVVMKIIVVIFEMGTFWLIAKLLKHFNLSLKYLLVYALNPLIILELSGNLHAEGVMIFFLMAAFYLFLNKHLFWASFCFLLAINTKLLPLVLFPYLVFSLGLKRSIKLIVVVVVGTVLLHIPFIGTEVLSHLGDSLTLFFQSSEFNASLYYIVRWVGFQLAGYNIIDISGPVLAICAMLIIVVAAWKMRDASLKNLPIVYLVSITVYLLFTTTVHPWYLVNIVAFAPLAGLLFPLVWSVVIPLTYIAYTTPVYNENLWLVTFEYLVVFGVMIYDYSKNKGDLKFQNVRRIL